MATNRLQFFKKHNIAASQSLSLMQISGLSGVPIAALNKVYARGIGAYRTQPTSVRAKGTFKKGQPLSVVPLSGRLSPQQWAIARIYSFVNKGKGTYYGADADIRKEFGV